MMMTMAPDEDDRAESEPDYDPDEARMEAWDRGDLGEPPRDWEPQTEFDLLPWMDRKYGY